MKQYILDITLKKSDDEAKKGDSKYVFLATNEEFKVIPEIMPHKRAMNHLYNNSDFCRSELFGGCILGVINMPIKKENISGKTHFGFYIQEKRLYLIGENEILASLLGRVKEISFPEDATIIAFFYSLLNSWIDEDALYVQKIEDKISSMEDILLTEIPSNFYRETIAIRKNLTVLHSYYYQMLNLCTAIRSNTNQMLTEEECVMYGYFADRIEHLRIHTETLREYVLQMREIYQTQIDLKQTRSMNLLAVISAIFLPLTLLVGWYGMNFHNMPELRCAFGYPAVIIASVAIIVIEIIIFKKKGLF